MKRILLTTSSVVLLALSGCGDSSNNNDNTGATPKQSTRFSEVVKSGDTVERDAQTGLEWVGSSGATSNACVPHSSATSNDVDVATAQGHCDTLIFAGHDDWRTATPAEHAAFITGMQSEGLTPFYLNPSCPRVIGVEDGNATAVNTHNSTPVGAQTPWSVLLTQGATNFGVKCVRTY